MSQRIGLIGDNSVEFVEQLLRLWNDGKSVIPIDCKIPLPAAFRMLREASADECYIEEGLQRNVNPEEYGIQLHTYTAGKAPALLSEKLYADYHPRRTPEEAIVFFSSGTTGASKGICLSHFAITRNAEITQERLRLTGRDIFYMAKPFAHSSTIVCGLLVALLYHIPVLISPISLPITNITRILERFQVTAMSIVPSQLALYLRQRKKRPFRLESFRQVNVGGDYLPPTLQVEGKEVFPNAEILNSYGFTEAGPRVTGQVPGGINTPGSVGTALEGVQIAVTDENGNRLPIGQEGIISVSAECRMNGYANDAPPRVPVYRDWLNSGDIGFQNEKGELFILGRKDEMLLVHGNNVYPNSVERRIRSLPEISDCLVFGAADSYGVQKLVCYYVAAADCVQDIRRHCREELAPYEIPGEIIRVEKIPRTENGKASRRLAAKKYANRKDLNGFDAG